VLCFFFAVILVSEKASIEVIRVADCKKNDGIGRIRTGDLRHVKTEDLGFFEAFSVGDITVRNANDPSYMV
jgi:hypothetical protein